MKNEKYIIKQSFGYYFNLIFLHLKRSMEEKLKPYDLTHLQFSILMNIHKNNLSTQKEILQYTHGDEAGITRLIDRLESKGYLKRVQSETDKRKKKIILTETGVKLIDEATQCAIDYNNELAKNLEPNESKELLRLLKKVHSSMY